VKTVGNLLEVRREMEVEKTINCGDHVFAHIYSIALDEDKLSV